MATNSTTYYNLPVFAATDQPKWLVDWNTSMEIIDGAIAQAKAAGDNAQTTANANAVAISGLNESVSTMSTALGTLTTNVTTITGNVQRINELIGNGTPTTTDKTIIGAINELKAEIDALAPGGAVQADEVEYDNTDSGLTATNVQDAIDELAQGGSSGGADLDLTAYTGDMTVTSSATVVTAYSDVKYALNADKSIGKIYGSLMITGSVTVAANTWTTIATLSSNDMPTVATAYNITLGFVTIKFSNTLTFIPVRLHFNTNGSIEVQVYNETLVTVAEFDLSLVPCLYILKDFGDQLTVGFTPRLFEALA